MARVQQRVGILRDQRMTMVRLQILEQATTIGDCECLHPTADTQDG